MTVGGGVVVDVEVMKSEHEQVVGGPDSVHVSMWWRQLWRNCSTLQ